MKHLNPTTALNCCRELVEHLLTMDEAIKFLSLWQCGNFDACRRDWPEVPNNVYPDKVVDAPVELDSTASAVVDKHYHWQPITPDTPRNQKLQLIHRPSGSAQYGTLAKGDAWFTHWARVPTFLDDSPVD